MSPGTSVSLCVLTPPPLGVGPILSSCSCKVTADNSLYHILPASNPAEKQKSTSPVIQMKILELSLLGPDWQAWVIWSPSPRNAVFPQAGVVWAPPIACGLRLGKGQCRRSNRLLLNEWGEDAGEEQPLSTFFKNTIFRKMDQRNSAAQKWAAEISKFPKPQQDLGICL